MTMWNNSIRSNSNDGSVMIYMDLYRCSLLPTDDDSWTTVRNANGDLIMGLFYPQSQYNNISIADISLLFSQRNLWLTPVTMEKNGIFILKSEVKCAICTKRMEICLKFIDINTSYIYDAAKSDERVRFEEINDDLTIGHFSCLGDTIMNKNDFFFTIQELRISFRKWWEMQTVETRMIFIVMTITIFSMVFLITLIIYMIWFDTQIFWNQLYMLLVLLLTCMFTFQYARGTIYLNGYYRTRREMRLQLRRSLN